LQFIASFRGESEENGKSGAVNEHDLTPIGSLLSR
jgi:hypothetical protein